MHTNKDNTTGRISGKTDMAMAMDTEEDKEKPTLDKTKEFVQSVLSKRRVRLELQRPVSCSAPTSPASNVSEVDLVWDEEEARSIKRRREDSRGSHMEEDVGHASSLAAKVRKTIRLIGKEIRGVAEQARERNTKKEIKEGTKTLVSLMSQLQTSEVQALLQSLGRHIAGKEPEDAEVTERIRRLEEENDELKAENLILREEISGLTTKGASSSNKRDSAVQCDDVEGECYSVRIRQELEECDAVSKFFEIAKKPWPDRMYECSMVKRGYLLRDENDIVLYARDGDMTTGLLARAAERFPELEGMGEQQLPDYISSLVVVTKTRQGEETLQKERTIYKVAPRAREDVELNLEFLEAMKDLQAHLERDGKQGFALAVPPELKLEDARKILEYVHRGTGRKATLYEERQRSTETMRPPRKDSGAIIVKAGGKSFTEALKEVKSSISGAAEGTLKGVRKTQRGDVLLIVKGGSDSVRTVEEKIRSTTNLKVQITERDRKTLFIQGVDGVTTVEEIEEAVKNHLGQEDTQGFQVMSLRAAMGNSQTATIATSDVIADRLLERGRINIGWLECPIKERVSVAKCFRCLEYGHIRAECKGPDRSNACYKCGANGHTAKECERPNDFCHACQREGHRSSSTKCPIFRKMVLEARNKGKFGRGNRFKGTPKR